jgi:hypothetical protein
MRCPHPECTGVHDNNRYSELCPRSRAAKRIKDTRYINRDTWEGFRVRVHRRLLASRRRIGKAYGPGSEYARLVGEALGHRQGCLPGTEAR